MVQIPTWSVILLAIFGVQKPEDSVLHRSSTLKILETQHLRIFYTGEFLDSAKVIGARGDGFLKELERRWGIVLPETRIDVTMIRVLPEGPWIDHDFDPPWLAANYSKTPNWVEIRARTADYRDGPAFMALKHHLVHALLNRGLTQPLPMFLEEGLARYYAGSRGSRQVYLAVLAFQRTGKLKPFVDNPYTYQIDQDFQYAGALGYQWVNWLWDKYPQAEKELIQAHLEGMSFDDALSAAGLPSYGKLLDAFDREMRPRFGLARLLKTYDFWLLAISLLAIIAVVFKVIAAVYHARSDFVEVVPKPETLSESLFQGPAFNPISNAPESSGNEAFTPLPALPEIPRLDTRKPSGTGENAHDDVVIPPMSEVLLREDSTHGLAGLELNTDELNFLDDQLDEVFDRIGVSKKGAHGQPNAPQPKRKRVDDNGTNEESDEEIDSDVDRFFNRIS